MKKLNILFAAALMFGLASCDDKSDLGVMQTNPQLNIMEANGIKLEYGDDLAAATLNLNNFENKDVQVIKLVEAENLPENASVEYTMDVSPYSDFSDFRTLEVTNGAVKGNDWENAILNMIGKTPLPVKNYVRFSVYAQTSNDLVRFGGEDFYYASKEETVVPVDLKLPIDDKYYLVYGTDESNMTKVEMSHSNRHPYDDPNFSSLLDISSADAATGVKWHLVSDKDNEFGVASTSDPQATEGSVVKDGANGVITSAGNVKLEVNMLDLTYKVSYAFEYIYTPGPANGWGFNDNMLLFTDDFVNYHGYVYVDSMFKLCGQPDWSPNNWGTPDGENLVQDGPNITVDENGLYYVTVNVNELTFTKLLITRIGVIGGFNGWGSDEALTPSADFKTWSGTVTVAEAGDWKFRMNNGWDLNLGGTNDNLEQNGANLSFPAAGTYEIVLNLGKLPYSCTVTAK